MRKSMNKTVVIIVLALFLTISVGYALFSDTITIEGTATAQGEFKMNYECSLGLAPELGLNASDINSDYQSENGAKNDYCTVTNSHIEYGGDLEYPGAYRIATLKVTNNNEFNVVLDPNTLTTKLDKYLNGELITDPITLQYLHIYMDLKSTLYTIKNGTVNAITPFELVEPGQTVYAILEMEWDSVDTGGYTNGNEVSAVYNVTFDYVQVTN